MSVFTYAETVKIDGVYYNLVSKIKEAEVTHGNYLEGGNDSQYQGDIIIPESVVYNNIEYVVTSIGDAAFGVYLTIAKASCASFPLIRSATILTFLADILAPLRVALASITVFSSILPITSFYFFTVVAFSPAWPLNVLVGANSPNLCPIISSETYTGTNFLPSCTAIV